MPSHAEQRREANKRRVSGTLFQPKRLGNYWYIVKWPEGTILPTGRLTSFEEAAELSKTYQAA